jgi:hypothetical protein
MISVAIGLLLLSCLTEIYLAVQRNLHIQTRLTQIQTNAQLALDILQTEITKSGNIGCAKLTNDFPIATHHLTAMTTDTKLMGSSNQITVRYAEFPSAEVQAAMQDRVRLEVSDNVRFKSGDVVIVSDCSHAEIFKIASISRRNGVQEIIASEPLQYTFKTHAELSHVIINSFYVCANSHSLCMRDYQHHQTELVNDVQSLRFLYSQWQNGKLIDLPATAIHDWSAVVGVAVDLLIGTPDLSKQWHDYVSLQS